MENSKDMAQHTYDNEAVQELLNWAKKMIETKNNRRTGRDSTSCAISKEQFQYFLCLYK